MSVNYNESLSIAKVKKNSREKIANEICKTARGLDVVIHYFGGRSIETPFEKLFHSIKSKTTFMRYEILKSDVPNNYQVISPDEFCLSKKLKESYGFFINQDFFKVYPKIFNKIPNNYVQYYWLDFCGNPNRTTINRLFYRVISKIKKDVDSVCYVTFLLNSRGLKDDEADKVFGGRGGSKETRAENIRKYFNRMNTGIYCDIVDIYQNNKSNMGVFKFTNKNFTYKPKTIETYNSLKNTGLTNDEIASYWRIPITRVAAYAAWSTMRKGLIINDTENKATVEKTNKEIEYRAA